MLHIPVPSESPPLYQQHNNNITEILKPKIKTHARLKTKTRAAISLKPYVYI